VQTKYHLNRLSFHLKPIPPFRLDLTAWTLRREPENRLDRWDGKTYRRLIAQNELLFEVSVNQDGDVEHPRLAANA
jgi:DNA-3-methyladenine glycosylase II